VEAGVRNDEYQGYLRTVADLRRLLGAELAEWYAGERTELHAGVVLGLCGGLSSLRYGRSPAYELDQVRKDAHRINRQLGRSCSCGTIKACPREPDPLDLYLRADDEEYFEDDEILDDSSW